mgnify:CR=1 FL=1
MISIVVPFFNINERFELLEGCIESILLQTSKDYEIVLIDDGSTDGTSQRVRGGLCIDLKKKQVPFIYKRIECNHGVCTARNAGVEFARGEIVAFLDYDDLLLSEYVKNITEYFKRPNSKVWAVCSAFYYSNFYGYEKLSGAVCEVNLDDFTETQLISFLIVNNFPFPMGSGIAIRRQYMLENKVFFSEKLNRETAEDVEFGFRLLSRNEMPHFFYKELIVCRSYYSFLSRRRGDLIRTDQMELCKYMYKQSVRKLAKRAEAKMSLEERVLFRRKRWEAMKYFRVQSLILRRKYSQWFKISPNLRVVKLVLRMFFIFLAKHSFLDVLAMWSFLKTKNDDSALSRVKEQLPGIVLRYRKALH